MVDIAGSLTQITQNVIKTGYLAAEVVLAAAVLFIFYWFVIRPTTYNIGITIWEERAGGIVETNDRGKIVVGKGGLLGFFTKDNVRRLKLLRKKFDLPVPTNDHFVRTTTGDKVYYYRYGQTDYQPVIFKELTEKFADLHFNPSSEDIKLWHIQESKDVLRRNTVVNKLQHVLVPIMIGVIFVMIIVATYMITGTLKNYISSSQAIATAQQETAEAIREAVATLKGTASAVPPG